MDSPSSHPPPDNDLRAADSKHGSGAPDDQTLGGNTLRRDVSLADQPTIASPPTARFFTWKEKPGGSIGRYRLIEEMGSGGFGVVWRAEQTEPIRREVALKVIKPGMDSGEVIARFEAERQALALMDHPNIASVLDAGTTENGRPYFVMELVKGVPISSYCDTRLLGLRQRIELFIPVCRGVQHAHQKAVLHRDLKPSNILVAEVDGHPVPRIIDFGIAKALVGCEEPGLSSTLPQTRENSVVGTPQYMSPEQAAGDLDIDTRSDIYTLGVIFYELLVGEPPLSRERVAGVNLHEVLRRVREEEPRRPSTHWPPDTENSLTQAQWRGTTPPKLAQQIRGDLDWIALKALEKDRPLRYATALEFAEDLERYLRNEPVHVSPPSRTYRLKKLFVRNKLLCIASTLTLLAIVVGAGVATWQWWVASQLRIAAVDAQHHAEDAKILAETREREATAARNREAKARALESEARQLEAKARKFADSQRQKAETARAQAEDLINYMLFDLKDKLEPLNRIGLLDDVATKAENYFGTLPEKDEPDAQRRNRGGMFQNRGRIDLALGRTGQALAAFEQFLRIMADRAKQAPDDPQRQLDLAVAEDRVGMALEQAGRWGDALKSYQDEFEIVQRIAGTDVHVPKWQRHLATSHERLGDALLHLERNAEAVPHYEEEHRIFSSIVSGESVTAEDQAGLATASEKLADVRMADHRLDEALALYEREVAVLTDLTKAAESDARLRRMLGVALQNQADALLAKGDTEKALQLLQQSLKTVELLALSNPGDKALMRDHAIAHGKLANGLSQAKRQAEALVHWQNDFEMTQTLAASDPANVQWQLELAVSHWNLAQARLRDGSKTSITQALDHYEQGRAILAKLKQSGTLDAAGATWLNSFDQAVTDIKKLTH